jgi:hypothetical protein
MTSKVRRSRTVDFHAALAKELSGIFANGRT